ncbi:MAG: hypothetical protein IIW99_09105 [Treponema sp.]|nr:hypothetical protein [Treponema sp.]
MEEDIDETQIDEERPITAWHDLKEYSSEDKKSVELLCSAEEDSSTKNYRIPAHVLAQNFGGLGGVEGSCSTSSTSTNKKVVLENYPFDFIPKEFDVLFLSENTSSQPMLEIYNSLNVKLGSLPVYDSTGRIIFKTWAAKECVTFRIKSDKACVLSSSTTELEISHQGSGKFITDLTISDSGAIIVSHSDPEISVSYKSLSDKPTIPDSTTQLKNDSGFITKNTANVTGSLSGSTLYLTINS